MSEPIDRLFGLKAKRLADLIGQQGCDVFDHIGLKVDAKLNSMIMSLTEMGPSTSSEIAKRIGLSRQLVEVRIRRLERDGRVTSEVDPQDARRRLYQLSEAHQKTFDAVNTVMADFEDVYEDLWEEIGVDLSDGISRLERALAKTSLTERLAARHPKYKSKLKERA